MPGILRSVMTIFGENASTLPSALNASPAVSTSKPSSPQELRERGACVRLVVDHQNAHGACHWSFASSEKRATRNRESGGAIAQEMQVGESGAQILRGRAGWVPACELLRTTSRCPPSRTSCVRWISRKASSRHALAVAGELAKGSDATLTIVHVWQPPLYGSPEAPVSGAIVQAIIDDAERVLAEWEARCRRRQGSEFSNRRW